MREGPNEATAQDRGDPREGRPQKGSPIKELNGAESGLTLLAEQAGGDSGAGWAGWAGWTSWLVAWLVGWLAGWQAGQLLCWWGDWRGS